MQEALIHITKWKKPVLGVCVPNDSNYMTFCKRQNFGYSEKITDFQ